jgi:MoxR-like ATPase
VIATQNPVEFRGTYPLPEAQMDRFAVQFGLGYVSADEEVAILSAQQDGHPIDALEAKVGLEDVITLRKHVTMVRMADELKRYAVELVRRTRGAPAVQLGASPRASLALMKAAQALALLEGRDFVTPEDVQELAGAVIAHRLAIDPQAKFSGVTGAAVVDDILRAVPAPA